MPSRRGDRLPWLKLWVASWKGDARLQRCSLAARALWLELMLTMHECTPYGHASYCGHPMTVTEIAAAARAAPSEVEPLLNELERHEVFSRAPDGTIFSRRMARDEEHRLRGVVDGKRGGNPALRGGDKGSGYPKTQPLGYPRAYPLSSSDSDSSPDLFSGGLPPSEVQTPVGAREPRKPEEVPLPFPIDRPEIREEYLAFCRHRAMVDPKNRWTPLAASRKLATLAKLGPGEALRWIKFANDNGLKNIQEPFVRASMNGNGRHDEAATSARERRALKELGL